MVDAPRTWVLTSAPDNHAATAERGFTVSGMKERRRNQAVMMEPGDRIVLYLMKVQRFASAIRLTGDLKLAFQGRLRTVSEADAALFMARMHAASAAGVAA